MYVLMRTDGAFVAREGSQSSYTKDLRKARRFPTKEAAERDRCVENERILTMDQALDT
jgi:hypothetical protein